MMTAMPKVTNLDKQWQQLMALCDTETKLRSEGGHDRLLRLIASDIEQLAGEMGFSHHSVSSRDFRAERDGAHIMKVMT